MADRLPLQGKRVLITRAKAQVQEFIDKIEAAGGIAIPAPLLEIRANDKQEQMIKTTILHLKNYDCIVFTSANGVSFFKSYLDKFNVSYSNLSHLIAASVGSKTSKQMEKLGLRVSIIPEEFVAEKLAESLSENLPEHSRILAIRGNLARPTLVTELKQKGFSVTDLVVYETIHKMDEAEKLIKYLQQDELDFITFTSSSTVDSFMKVLNQKELQDNLRKVVFVCIGPITNDKLNDYGYNGIMPHSYTIDAMVKLMIEHEMSKEGL
ncbi:uroporphyrinogen-III synthase [Metabacillus sp. Hm71]|uniref:uroporphyrinogen-III synthase n=1 Tax=Metabacillus sp. Hm71 TaxID=3450743 RepID=UPI003F43417A